MKQDAWVSNESILNKATTARFKVGMDAVATPGLAINNGTQSSSCGDLPVGTWGRVYASFTGSTSDFLKAMGGAPVSGVNCGNNSSASNRRLGANQNLTAFSAITVYAVGEAKRTPTAGEMASLDAWVTANVKSGLV